MMVPRAFTYSSAPSPESLDEKRAYEPVRRRATKNRITSAPRLPSPMRTTTTEPPRTPTQPVSVPTPARTYSAGPQTMPTSDRQASSMRRKSSNHNPNAIPPSVAALLAVTEIPRPKKGQFRRSANPRRMSLDELVNEWKNENTTSNQSYGSSPGLSILMEDPDMGVESCPSQVSSVPEGFLCTRSVSAESVPSLEADDRSILSSGSLSTPESLRSRRSINNLKKEKSRSLPASEECSSNHPLAPPLPGNEDPDDNLMLSPSSTNNSTLPRKSTFKSNLTSSLQALKNAAISSFTSFTGTTPQPRTQSSPMPDDILWSHPFLFPRFSSEVRPAITGTPTKAQRRYLNPHPLTFEEQETPYQLALHAPYLAEQTAEATHIQMQTYTRRRKSARKSPDPSSEAGRALLGAAGVRQREPRENTDFLRMIVAEMNMKRSGKLAYGRAKIMLPPRKVCVSPEEEDAGGGVPRRWVGVSAAG